MVALILPVFRLSQNMARWRRATLTCALVAASACNCGITALKRTGPVIEVEPDPISLGDAVTGSAVDTTVQVSNKGLGALILKQTPFVVMTTPVSTPVYAVVDVFTQNCDGSAHSGSSTITAGGCATLDLRFYSTTSGEFDGVLRFLSNDPVHPTLDVPITANAGLAHAQVCFEKNGMETCNTDGQPLVVTDADMVALGSTDNLSFEVKALSARDVNLTHMTLSGNSDFGTTPATSAFRPTTVMGGGDWPFTVAFAPVEGGPQSATVSFVTDDPLNTTLTVVVKAQAAGPGLCYCLAAGSPTATCTMTNTANFGDVGLMATGDMYLELSSCGTEPLTLSTVALASGSPEFTATNLPAANTVMAPGATPLVIPLTFTPTLAQPYYGQLSITTPQESGSIVLEGTGVISGCALSAATSIDFGSVQKDVTAEKTLAVSNRGTEACAFPQVPAITVGASVQFALAMFPLQPLGPGQSAVFEVTYTPQTLDSGDTGQLTIYYLPSSAATGTTPKQLTVALSGTPVAQATCVLTADPAAGSIFGRTLNFGQVRVGTTATLPATFRNTGSADCTIDPAKLIAGIPLTGSSDIGAFKITTQPMGTLPPGMTTTVQVAFTPTAETSYGSPIPVPGFPSPPGFGDAVQVQTSDDVSFTGVDCPSLLNPQGPAGCVGWDLSGEGVTSDLIVLPSSIDFGSVTLGCESLEKTVTMYNVGQIPIHVTGFTIDPAPPPAIFQVYAPATPITINAGDDVSIHVQYSPSQLGTETGTLYIDSDATNGQTGGTSNPYVTVSLNGSGTSVSSQTDTFVQPDHSTVDVLWVIDQDSDSMADKIAAIAANASTFIQTAVQDNTDFHLGVVSVYISGNLTTNCGGANCTQGSSFTGVTISPGVLYHGPSDPAWVSSTDANPVQGFQNEVQLGVSAAVEGEEAGLEGMYLALSSPNITGPNSGFLRDNARLIVIAISDDDDVNSPKTPAFYAAFLQSLKPNDPASATFSMVGGDMPNGCTNGVDGDAPVVYNQVVTATGGRLYSLCNGTSGFSSIASSLGVGSFGGQTRFVLSRPCDPTTLVVTVNGTTLHQGTDYTFSATENAINLATAPAPGATITATYNTLCM
jgi:hypothetical protein